jgi:hypothetical protein
LRHAAVTNGILDRAADKLPRAGMRGMPFHNDRAARRERRGGVPAGHGESQRKIAGSEYCDRAERNVALAQIGPRQRFALGQRRIDSQIEIFSRAHHVGEKLELSHGSRALAFEPSPWQPALCHGALNERIAERKDVCRNRFEKACPLFA